MKRIFHYIYHLLDDKGNFPQYGDEDDGKCLIFDGQNNFNNFRSLLSSGALIFNDSILKSGSHGIDRKNQVLFGDDSVSIFKSIPEIQPERKSKFFNEEGHFYFRKLHKGREINLHVDAAPLGYLSIAAHAHADALSFILSLGGKPIFVDPGTYTYHTEPEWRNYFIGTLAHNTIRINQRNQATIAGPTLWLDHYKIKVLESESTEEIDRVTAEHNGYKTLGINHKREFLFYKKELKIRITDTIEASDNNNYFIEMPFHLHPDMKIEEQTDHAYSIRNSKHQSDILLNIDNSLNSEVKNGQTSPEIIGWYSKSFMKKEATNTIYCSIETSGNQRFETLISIN